MTEEVAETPPGGPTPFDISSERFRVYTYQNGATFRIDSPKELYVLKDENGATHRIVDADGMTHRPERGWVGISWKPRPGAPAFDF